MSAATSPAQNVTVTAHAAKSGGTLVVIALGMIVAALIGWYIYSQPAGLERSTLGLNGFVHF